MSTAPLTLDSTIDQQKLQLMKRLKRKSALNDKLLKINNKIANDALNMTQPEAVKDVDGSANGIAEQIGNEIDLETELLKISTPLIQMFGMDNTNLFIDRMDEITSGYSSNEILEEINIIQMLMDEMMSLYKKSKLKGKNGNYLFTIYEKLYKQQIGERKVYDNNSTNTQYEDEEEAKVDFDYPLGKASVVGEEDYVKEPVVNKTQLVPKKDDKPYYPVYVNPAYDTKSVQSLYTNEPSYDNMTISSSASTSGMTFKVRNAEQLQFLISVINKKENGKKPTPKEMDAVRQFYDDNGMDVPTKWADRLPTLKQTVSSSTSSSSSSIPGKGFAKKVSSTVKRVISGRGVSVPEEKLKKVVEYIPFGLFVVHKNQLDTNILTLKYKKSMQQVTAPLNRQRISVELTEFLKDVLEYGKVNQRLFDKLDVASQQLFCLLVKRSGLIDYLPFKVGEFKQAVSGNPDQNDIKKRYELLKGEYIAGNKSKVIRDELKDVLLQLISKKVIDKDEGWSLLNKLI